MLTQRGCRNPKRVSPQTGHGEPAKAKTVDQQAKEPQSLPAQASVPFSVVSVRSVLEIFFEPIKCCI
jgi:hypothetical protein